MANNHQQPFQELLLIVEKVEIKTGDGSKLCGILSLFGDRIEWHEEGTPPQLSLVFPQVEKMQVARSLKNIAVQFVRRNNLQPVSFYFVNPEKSRDELIAERDQVVELTHHLLRGQREVIGQMIGKMEKSTDEKERLLAENKELQDIYRHLVVTKVIKPAEFWTEYIKKVKRAEQGRGRGCFLTSLVQTEGRNGLKLMLTPESIGIIFKTFPSVMQRHKELVPSKFTEELFWAKFFHSYYFNRDRPVENKKNDPFLQCIKADDADMDAILESAYVKKSLDETFLKDDTGILKNEEDEENNKKKNESKNALLIRRCNYQSGRILQTALGVRWSKLAKTNSADASISVKASKVGDERCSPFAGTSAQSEAVDLNGEEIVLESAELATTDDTMQRYLAGVDVFSGVTCAKKTVTPEESARYRALMTKICSQKRDPKHIERYKEMMKSGNDPLNIPDGQLNSSNLDAPRLPTDVTRNQIVELMAVTDSCYELARRFWENYPPCEEAAERKVASAIGALKKYKRTQLLPLGKTYGKINIESNIHLILVRMKAISLNENSCLRALNLFLFVLMCQVNSSQWSLMLCFCFFLFV
ncbi:hypothetical protein L596_004598 [Steinernema carpocapsae]|uniref:BSD domain-containing protein n=1 Tax=Steinernema carpocapsae TaxID=34508 RepID=A0A4U8UXW5_STECR|nr:hypothetical protein L596_004598 [Steinernema carpocapsae]